MSRDETKIGTAVAATLTAFAWVAICPIDGRGIVLPAVGRRRTYCSGRCRTRAWRARQRELVALIRPLADAWIPAPRPIDD